MSQRKPDWSSHFRQLSKAQRAQAEFGTIAGQYTIAELKDLLLAKDADMATLAGMAGQYLATWQSKNPQQANAWNADYQALLSRYASAKRQAQVAILAAAGANFIPDSMIPADDTYKNVLASLNPGFQSNTSAPGSYSDLSQRIVAGGAAIPNAGPVPQPNQTDFDISTFKATNTVSANIPRAVKVAAGVLDPNIIPQDHTASQFDPTSFVKDHWEGLAIGGVGLIVTLKLLSKFGL